MVIMKRFTRDEIRARLDARLAKKEPILACEAGVGITAKMYEMYDIDLIFATSAGVFRSRGIDDVFSLTAYGECNEMTYELVRRIHGVTNHTPVIAGINVTDPRCILETQVRNFKEAGVSGIINSPSIAAFVSAINILEGTPVERDMLTECREKEMFTVADCFFREDIKTYAESKPDMMIINLKWAVEEGISRDILNDQKINAWFPKKPFDPAYYNDIEACCKEIQECYEEIKAISPETYVLVHGGPFTTFEAAEKLFALTDVEGFLGSKCFDTDVMRKYILENQAAFSSLTLNKEAF